MTEDGARNKEVIVAEEMGSMLKVYKRDIVPVPSAVPGQEPTETSVLIQEFNVKISRALKIFKDIEPVNVVIDGEIKFNGWVMNPHDNDVTPKGYIFVLRRDDRYLTRPDGVYKTTEMKV